MNNKELYKICFQDGCKCKSYLHQKELYVFGKNMLIRIHKILHKVSDNYELSPNDKISYVPINQIALLKIFSKHLTQNTPQDIEKSINALAKMNYNTGLIIPAKIKRILYRICE